MQVAKRLRRGAALWTAVLLMCGTAAAETTATTAATASTATATAAASNVTAGTAPTAPTETLPTATAPTAAVQPDGDAASNEAVTPTEPTVSHRVLIDAEVPLDAAAAWYGPAGEEDYLYAPFTEGRNGKKALRFDGTRYMSVDIAAQTAPFTLSFWVNWQAELSEERAAEQLLFSVKLKNGEDGYYCFPAAKRTMDNGDTVNGLLLNAVCFDEQGVWQRQAFYYPAAKTVSNGLPHSLWHHMAFVVEEHSISLYLDGLLWKTAETPFAYSTVKADRLFIGASDTSSAHFCGLMQDFRLYAGALTAQQVGRLAIDADAFDAAVTVAPQEYTPTPAAEAITDKCYTAKTVDGKTGIMDAAAAFWETPRVDAGQSVTGTLTLENLSKHTADIALQVIVLPEQGTAAWRYLSCLQLTVQQNGETLFSGPYTEVTAEKLALAAAGMDYSRRVQYTVTLSRGFDSEGGITEVQVPWQVTAVPADVRGQQPRERRHALLLAVLLLSAALLIAGVVLAVEKRRYPFFAVWDTLWEKRLQPAWKKCITALRRLRRGADGNEEETL